MKKDGGSGKMEHWMRKKKQNMKYKKIQVWQQERERRRQRVKSSKSSQEIVKSNRTEEG